VKKSLLLIKSRNRTAWRL